MKRHGVVLLGIVSAVGAVACSSETVRVVSISDNDSGTTTGGSAQGGGGSGGRGGAGTGGTSGRAATGGRGGASACTPTIAATPAWVPPSPLHQGVCTPAEVDRVASNCADGQASTPCAPDAADACRACMITAPGDSSYGALIHFAAPPVVFPNSEGCVAALTGDLSSSGCGAKSAVAKLCTVEACSGCLDPTSYAACVDASVAEGGPCKTLWDERGSCLTSVGPRIWSACSGTQNVIDGFRKVGALFCGAGVDDAGTDGAPADAGSDAPADDGG